MKYIQLIRYKNLLLIALMQALFHFVFLKNQTNYVSLSDFQFILLIIATVCIAAGGYIINDIEDQETDNINKPEKKIIGNKLSEDIAFYIYMGLTITGVCIGFYLSNVIEKNSFVGFFIINALLLYMYATSIKKIPVIGNLLIASLLASSVLLIGFFDIIPSTYSENYKDQMYLFSILIDFAIFAFIINFIREIIKDIEDFNGDKSANINTLPVIIGIKKTKQITIGLTILATAILLFYISKNFINANLLLAYSLIFILGPIILFLIKLFTAHSKKDFKLLGNILKIILLFGILSIIVIQINLA